MKLLVIRVVGLIGIPIARFGLSTPPTAGPPAHDQQAKEIVRWHLESTSDGALRAVMTTGVASIAPYFDGVRLERVEGAATTDCGSFGSASLGDNGVNRFWVYTRAKAATGACAGRVAGAFVAVGTKGGIETRSEPAP